MGDDAGSELLVSVLVVTFNHADEVGPCIDAALGQAGPAHRIEVVVADNASTDGTPELIGERYGSAVTLLCLEANRGYAEGVNAAFAASRGEVVVLLNPDCVMDEGCVETLWRHLAGNPGVGVAAALLRYPDGRPQLFARRELTMGDVIWGLTEAGRRVDRRWRGGAGLARRRYEHEFAAGVTEPLEVDCPAAACVAVWRRLLEPRPLDPAFPLVFNDAELYRRLRGRAYRCEVVPAAGAEHAYGTSLRRVARPRMRAEFVASMRRYASPPWGRARAAALWGVLAADAVSSAVLGVTGPDRRSARSNARGTLGGLGLPGGAEPWLTPVAPPPRRAKALVRRALPDPRMGGRLLARRLRRRWFLIRLHLAAWTVRSRVTAEVDPSADLPTDVVFEIRPRCRVRVVVGPQVHVQPGLILRLGGTLEIGRRSQVRYGVSLNVKGRLALEGRNVIGRGATIHTDGEMRWGWGAMVGEYVSVIDSDHALDGTPIHPLDHPVVKADVRLGAACFVAAHSTVTSGVSIGAATVVGANSVVSRDLPAGVLAVGAPATPVRDLPRTP